MLPTISALECVGVLTEMLERHAETDPTANGFIIDALLHPEGAESIDAMRAAFDADSVDISIAGDKEDVEIELGLRKKRDTPKPRYQPLLEMLMARSKVQWRTPPAEQRDWGTPSLKVYPPREGPKIGRNDSCPCGSGVKYKRCCGRH